MRDSGHIQSIKELLFGLAAYYGAKLEDVQYAWYAEDLADLSLEELKQAVLRYRRNPKNMKFPLPAHLKQEIAPQETPEDGARVAESEIWAAVASCGRYQPDRAKRKLGSLAWEGVTRFGGWDNVCNAANQDGSIYRAQMRGTLESIYRRAQSGQLEEYVALPESKRGGQGLVRLFGPRDEGEAS